MEEDNTPQEGEQANDNDEEAPAQVEHASEEVHAQADAILETAREESRSQNKTLRNVIIGLLVVTLIGGLAFLFLLGGDDNADDAVSNEDENAAIDDTSMVSDLAEPMTFDQIIYAHSATAGAAYEVFLRPISGGDRTSTDFNLGSAELAQVSRDGDEYVVQSDNKLFYGKAGDEPSLIFEATSDISTFDLDTSSSSILVSEVEFDSNDVRTVFTEISTVDGTTKQFAEYVPGGAKSFYINTWSGDEQKVYGATGCYACDGVSSAISSMDSSASPELLFDPSEILETGDQISNSVISDDGSKALYLVAKTASNQESSKYKLIGGISPAVITPYTMYEVDIATGSATKIIDEIGSPTDDLVDNRYSIPIPFYSDEGAIGYSYLNNVYVQNQQGEFDNYFETDKPITSIYRVDANEVLVGAQLSDGGETISYYNIETKKGAIVMETTSSTRILGVTLK